VAILRRRSRQFAGTHWRALWVGALIGASVTAACLGTALAVRNISSGSQAPATNKQITYTAATGSIEHLLHLGMTVSWAVIGTVRVGSGGVVTSLPTDPVQAVSEGMSLLTVNLEPVIAVAGGVPFFRELSEAQPGSLSLVGPDVSEWQSFLLRQGQQVKVTGTYDRQTTTATKAWQLRKGLTVTGRVEVGQVVAFSVLPARVRLDSHLEVGSQLQAGDRVAEILAKEPTNRAQLGPSPSGVEQGMTVRLASQPGAIGIVAAVLQTGNSTDASSTGSASTAGGASASATYEAAIESASGGALCDADCAAAAYQAPTVVPVDVVLLKRVDGVMVPASAIRSGPGGEASVLLPTGELRPVTVVGQGDGMVVVSGVSEGERVVVGDNRNG